MKNAIPLVLHFKFTPLPDRRFYRKPANIYKVLIVTGFQGSVDELAFEPYAYCRHQMCDKRKRLFGSLLTVKYLINAAFAAVLLAATAAVFGQETQEKVVDAVVAQVNNDVITLSKVKREIKN